MANAQLYFPLLIDGEPCWLEYGVDQHPDDWQCLSCSALNYHYRTVCYKCQAPPSGLPKKSSSNLNDGSEDISKMATSFILVRQIPSDLSETELYERFGRRNFWMARDKQTYAPRCFAFIEFADVEAATVAMQDFQESNASFKFDFGRDLRALSSLLGVPSNGSYHYWDPLVILVPFPPMEDKFDKHNSEPSLKKLKTETTAFGSLESRSQSKISSGVLTTASAPKKIQVQFKKWEQRSDEIASDPLPIIPITKSSFIPEGKSSVINFEDTVRNICLLCFRQFNDSDYLRRHTQESSLHRTNMEAYEALRLRETAFQDRAAERREFDPESSHPVKTKRTEYSVEKPLGSDNIGAKLLKKMGWKEGEGLGRDASGIVEPIKASGRTLKETAGIGMARAKQFKK